MAVKRKTAAVENGELGVVISTTTSSIFLKHRDELIHSSRT